MTNQAKAYIFALVSVLLWSTVASAFKISLRYLTPVELLFYAACFSCCVLFGALVLQKKLTLLGTINGEVWRTSLLFGVLSPFLYYLILLKAYDLLPAQQAQPLNYTWAITLSLLSAPLLGHRLKILEIAAVLVSYLGVWVISTQGNVFSLKFENPLGVILALGSTVIWALYWIANTRDRRDPVMGLFLNFLCSLPFIGLYLLVTEGFRKVEWVGLFGAAYVGTFEMGIAFITWLMAMKLTDSTAKIANLIFISPFLSLVLIHFIVGEKIMLSSVVGLIFIVAGLLIQAAAGKQNQTKS
ncbi:MAG: DMT family transporter [Desulfofustis sp.]|nr:DMT family transporter [Desulfofustis sp.]NNF45465.1 DMT family transporter [Desulfofustis sp.]